MRQPMLARGCGGQGRSITAVAGQLGGQAPMARAALAGYEQAGAAGHAGEDLHAIAALY